MNARRKCEVCGFWLPMVGKQTICRECQKDLSHLRKGSQIRSIERDWKMAKRMGLSAHDEAAEFLRSQGVSVF